MNRWLSWLNVHAIDHRSDLRSWIEARCGARRICHPLPYLRRGPIIWHRRHRPRQFPARLCARVSLQVGLNRSFGLRFVGTLLGPSPGTMAAGNRDIQVRFNVFLAFPGLCWQSPCGVYRGGVLNSPRTLHKRLVGYARLIRGQVLRFENMTCPGCAGLGASDAAYCWPTSAKAVQPLIVQASLGMAGQSWAEHHSLFWTGVPPPAPSWEWMIEEGAICLLSMQASRLIFPE